MHREDFNLLNTGIIYFDNGATTLKPQCVIDAAVDYETRYTANAHRGEYQNSLLVDQKIDQARKEIAKFIHASSEREIIFTESARREFLA